MKVTISLALLLAIANLAALINHIIWCIDKADETGSAIALLVVGVIIPPIGAVHGWALWLGYTWI